MKFSLTSSSSSSNDELRCAERTGPRYCVAMATCVRETQCWLFILSSSALNAFVVRALLAATCSLFQVLAVLFVWKLCSCWFVLTSSRWWRTCPRWLDVGSLLGQLTTSSPLSILKRVSRSPLVRQLWRVFSKRVANITYNFLNKIRRILYNDRNVASIWSSQSGTKLR